MGLARPTPRELAALVVGLGVGLALGWAGRSAVEPAAPKRTGEAVAMKSAMRGTVAGLAPQEEALRPATGATLSGEAYNVLVLVADDVGQDMLGMYDLPARVPATPNLDALAARGVRFREVVANPVCSPSRATLLTGRQAWRVGVGNAIAPKPGWDLPLSERTIAAALEEASGGRYRTWALGKWHLATPDRGGWDHPRRMGFDHHAGTMGNLLGAVDGVQQTYFRWLRVDDGVQSPAEGYITSATVDDALRAAQEGTEPFFLWVGFHAAHFPMHAPPASLYTTKLSPSPTEADLYRAMIEAMDTEIGRLLAGIPPDVMARTLVVFLGDNGSAPAAVEPPFQKQLAKGTLARGGTQVPLIVAGPPVTRPGSTSGVLVSTTDLFATVAELVGLTGPLPEDSTSFLYAVRDPEAPSVRQTAYTERFGPNGPAETWTYHEAIVRDLQHKLLVRNGAEVGLYDLVADPMERHNLFRTEPTAELRAALKKLRRMVPEVAKVKRVGDQPDEQDE